jgi:hypothetical protein
MGSGRNLRPRVMGKKNVVQYRKNKSSKYEPWYKILCTFLSVYLYSLCLSVVTPCFFICDVQLLPTACIYCLFKVLQLSNVKRMIS